MPIYLVRHGHAGSRSNWDGDDRDRPLSKKGHGQAAWLVERLGDEEIRRVVSSPYLRCVQTVEPLGAHLGRDVLTDPRLAEGARTREALDWLRTLSPKGVVASTHGDLIPKVLRHLVADGLRIDGPVLDAKGSIWVLDHDDDEGHPTRGHYLPPAAHSGH